MIKRFLFIPKIILVPIVFLFSCNTNKETPESIADRWCELNKRALATDNSSEQQKALKEREAFELSMEKKYEKDTAMMQAIFRAVEACENSSEKTNRSDADNKEMNDSAILSLAYGDATVAANAYCSLIDKSLQSAQQTSATLNKVISTKVMFEKSMAESYRNNGARRDSIFTLIEPCVAKEVQARMK